METIKLLKTEDGSDTLYHAGLNEVYHSKHGAITESLHVFIRAGLEHRFQRSGDITLLEIGMGTGLNVLLSALAATKHQRVIRYVGIEPYPPDPGVLRQLNYPLLLAPDAEQIWSEIHSSQWEIPARINAYTELLKQNKTIGQAGFPDAYFDLVYFDAFAPEVQPGLWELNIFRKIYGWMCPGGILVTYSAKGDVRRRLNESGFETERIPGPPGKREMIRAGKPLIG